MSRGYENMHLQIGNDDVKRALKKLLMGHGGDAPAGWRVIYEPRAERLGAEAAAGSRRPRLDVARRTPGPRLGRRVPGRETVGLLSVGPIA